jgi:hypothetical protein
MEMKKFAKELFENLEVSGNTAYLLARCIRRIRVFFTNSIYSDKVWIARTFRKVFGYKLRLDSPQTLNEKIQWLKLYERKDFHTQCADKYAVREFLKKEFGEEYLILLIFVTDKWKEINEHTIKEFPCILKANHASGDFLILRNPEEVNWKRVQLKCRVWLDWDFYKCGREWQYKNIKRRIVVEHLLQTKDGHIPNDYKLHYLNGELQFVYVSIDREGANKRNIYDMNWNPLFFSWVGKHKNAESLRGEEVDPPATFDKMKEIAKEIAKRFKYVRVDFYDVDGKLYFGEITLHHGSGFNVFTPPEYDLRYGQLLKL